MSELNQAGLKMETVTDLLTMYMGEPTRPAHDFNPGTGSSQL